MTVGAVPTQGVSMTLEDAVTLARCLRDFASRSARNRAPRPPAGRGLRAGY
jgi:2-polyprenyl-6-methoxyphenol hydroxylase-like FAD-dependent oxidoreductase